MACQVLCSPYITVSQEAKGNLLLKSFCRQFEGLYGAKLVTPNMHMHTHLCECILDFGPVYAFWLFSFERYNGIMGGYETNNRAIELQLMRKFLRDQSVCEITPPDFFQADFQSLVQPIAQTGTLLEMEFQPMNAFRTIASMCHGTVETSDARSDISMYHCLRPSRLDCLEDHEVPYLRQMYENKGVLIAIIVDMAIILK